MRKSRKVFYLISFIIVAPICVLLRFFVFNIECGISDNALINICANSFFFLLVVFSSLFFAFETGREIGIKELAEKSNKNPADYYDKDKKNEA